MTNDKTSKERTSHGGYVALGGLVAATLLSGTALMATKVSAEESTSETVSVTVSSSCTITGTNTDHTTTAVNGNITPDIGLSTINARCNDANGFAIYAIGYTGDTDGNNKLVNSTLGPSADIATGTNTTGNSSWSMKLATTTSPEPTYPVTITTGYDDYHAVPDDYTLVVKRTAPTDVGTNATGAIFTTTYRAYISDTQPAGTYTGKVKYVLVHPNEADAPESPPKPQPSTAGYITYYANAKNTTGTMGTQSATDNASVTLYSSNFSRPGYGFAGWSNKHDYATSTAQDLKFYGPNETITVPTGTTANGLSLYAVWIKSQGSLQDATKVAALCGTGTGSLTQAPTNGTANLASVSALTDERDNQTYAIAKLADGNCWMIENLRLENTGQHNTDGSLAQGYNSSFIGLATPESADFSNSTTANSLYSTDGSTDATISGSYQGYRFPRYNNFNTQQRATDTTNTNVNTYSDGNYYTWHAAIADTTHYSSGDHGTTSICPTGWRLPQGNTTTTGFGKLDVEMGGTGAYQGTAEASNRWRKYPANFLYSGLFNGSSADTRGSYGFYWSSTAYNNGYSYYLLLDSSLVGPGTNINTKYYGLSIRCTVSGS